MSHDPNASPAELVLLGLGANLGDPVAQLADAVEAARTLLAELRVSSLYRGEPVGYAAQPDFYNLVAAGYARLPPHEHLHALQAIEQRQGRRRSFANAPRTIDVDLLAYGERVLESPELTLPHPRLAQRGFVLQPLAELLPGWRHPLLKQTARELLAAGAPFERLERLGPLPGGSGGNGPAASPA
jgi:2-amino-4-hydroxy-6-hydroxymethyldihydropteridine diphosphokinase